MIISDEQARAAARYLRDTHGDTGSTAVAQVPDDIIERACEAAAASPDTRPERVVEAVERMKTHTLDSHDIAEKMLSRILSDALR